MRDIQALTLSWYIRDQYLFNIWEEGGSPPLPRAL